MKAFTNWWVRLCLKYQARKTSRQTVRWPVLPTPLPNSPGVSISVDYFGALLTMTRRNSYILLFTGPLSRRVNMFSVTAAEFSAGRNVYILVNRFISLWGCPSTLLFDNGLNFCAQLVTAIYKLLGIHKLTTSTYPLSGNGNVKCINDTIVQMLAMFYNKHQNDWDAPLIHVEYVFPLPFSFDNTMVLIRASTATISPIVTLLVSANNAPTIFYMNSTPSPSSR